MRYWALESELSGSDKTTTSEKLWHNPVWGARIVIPTCWLVWWRHQAQLGGGWSAGHLSVTAEHQSRRRSRPEQSSSVGLSGMMSSSVPAPLVNHRCHSYKPVQLWRKPPKSNRRGNSDLQFTLFTRCQTESKQHNHNKKQLLKKIM